MPNTNSKITFSGQVEAKSEREGLLVSIMTNNSLIRGFCFVSQAILEEPLIILKNAVVVGAIGGISSFYNALIFSPKTYRAERLAILAEQNGCTSDVDQYGFRMSCSSEGMTLDESAAFQGTLFQQAEDETSAFIEKEITAEVYKIGLMATYAVAFGVLQTIIIKKHRDKAKQELKRQAFEALADIANITESKQAKIKSEKTPKAALQRPSKDADLPTMLEYAAYCKSQAKKNDDKYARECFGVYKKTAKNFLDLEPIQKLADCYENGFGTPKNPDEAKKWRDKIPTKGVKTAAAEQSSWRFSVPSIRLPSLPKYPKVPSVSDVHGFFRSLCGKKPVNEAEVIPEQIVQAQVNPLAAHQEQMIQTDAPQSTVAQQEDQAQTDQTSGNEEKETVVDTGEGLGLNLETSSSPQVALVRRTQKKKDPLCSILEKIEKSLEDKNSWPAKFIIIARNKQIRKIKSASKEAQDKINKLFTEQPELFFEFLYELKQEVSSKLLELCLPEVATRMKKLEEKGCDVLLWITQQVNQHHVLSNILCALAIFKSDKAYSKELFDKYKKSATAHVVGINKVDEPSVKACFEDLQGYIDTMNSARTEQKDLPPSYSKQDEEQPPSYEEQYAQMMGVSQEKKSEKIYKETDFSELHKLLRGSNPKPVPRKQQTIAAAAAAPTAVPAPEPAPAPDKPTEQVEVKQDIPTLDEELEYIPDDALLLWDKLEEAGYTVWMHGSRAYNPIPLSKKGSYEDKTRDIDLVTDAPPGEFARIAKSLGFNKIRDNIKIKIGSGEGLLCKATGPTLGQDFDIRYNPDIKNLKNDLHTNDMKFRCLYVNRKKKIFDLSGEASKDKDIISFFEPGTEAFLKDDPARILQVIFAMSLGKKLLPADEAALKNSLPALAKIVAENPVRLLFPLLKNFTRGNSAENFKLMEKYGVFYILFPLLKNPLSEKSRQQFIEFFSHQDKIVQNEKRIVLTDIYAEILFACLSPVKHIDTIISELKLISSQSDENQAVIRTKALGYLMQYLARLKPQHMPQPILAPQPSIPQYGVMQTNPSHALSGQVLFAPLRVQSSELRCRPRASVISGFGYKG